MVKGLKLFVWPEFQPDYSKGLAFAIAESEEEAKNLIYEQTDIEYEEGSEFYPEYPIWGVMEVHPIEKIAFGIPGGA